jgi:hypothetical protein
MVGEGWSLASIARKFDVDHRTVSDIAHGKTYKDIPGPRRAVHEPTNRFFNVSKHAGKWRAQLWLDGKLNQLGRFGFEVDAAVCINAHIAYLGLDRPLNVIPEGEWCHD